MIGERTRRAAGRALVIVEVAGVFVLGALAGRAIAAWLDPRGIALWTPALRMAVLVTLAATVDATLRRRSIAAWGFGTGGSNTGGVLLAAIGLLVVAGAPALPLAAAARGSAPMTSTSWLAGVMGLITPVLGQEVFLTGYALTRLSDRFAFGSCVGIVASAFAAAHAAHANGALGFAFVLAMAVQGVAWTVVRLRGRTIVPQILAHVALLALYGVPLPMALGVLALGALVFAWARGRSVAKRMVRLPE